MKQSNLYPSFDIRQLALSGWLDAEHPKTQTIERRNVQVYTKRVQHVRSLDLSKRIHERGLSEEEVMWFVELKKRFFIPLGLSNSFDLISSVNWDGRLDDQEKILEDDYIKGRR